MTCPRHRKPPTIGELVATLRRVREARESVLGRCEPCDDCLSEAGERWAKKFREMEPAEPDHAREP